MDHSSEEYTVHIRVKFTDLQQLTRFAASESILAERCRHDLGEGYVGEIFEKHGICELGVTIPAEIYFAEGSGGLQEIQADLNAARQVGAEIELTMGWTKEDGSV